MNHPYTPCRWYDPYPRLAFGLKLLQMMPQSQQDQAGLWLLDWLNRTMPKKSAPAALPYANRWYDQSPALAQALRLLQTAPAPILQQSADILHAWLNPQH